MSFRPFEPISNDAATDWAQKIHRAAFEQRKIAYGPDTLTSHTTKGVIQRLKPVIPPPPTVNQIQSEFFYFTIDWDLVNGCRPDFPGGDVVQTLPTGATVVTGDEADTVNTAIDLFGSGPGHQWPNSIVRLPHPISDGWQLLVAAYQTQFGNIAIDHALDNPILSDDMSYISDERLGCRLITAPGVDIGGASVPLVYAFFPPTWDAALVRNVRGGSIQTTPDETIADTTSDPTGNIYDPGATAADIGEDQNTYLYLDRILASKDLFIRYGGQIFLPGTRLQIHGLGWKTQTP